MSSLWRRRALRGMEDFAQQWGVDEVQDQTGLNIPTRPTLGGGFATIFRRTYFPRRKPVHEDQGAIDHQENTLLTDGHSPKDARDLATTGHTDSLHGNLVESRKSPEPPRRFAETYSLNALMKDLPQAHLNLVNAQEELRRAEELAAQPISSFLKKEQQNL